METETTGANNHVVDVDEGDMHGSPVLVEQNGQGDQMEHVHKNGISNRAYVAEQDQNGAYNETGDKDETMLFDVEEKSTPSRNGAALFAVDEKRTPSKNEAVLFDVEEKGTPSKNGAALFAVDEKRTPSRNGAALFAVDEKSTPSKNGAELFGVDDKSIPSKNGAVVFDVEEKSKRAKDANVGTCRDPVHRSKIFDTVWIYWMVIALGVMYGQVGPALPDLQMITGAPLQQAAWIITGFSIGYLVGCLLGGLVQDKINSRLRMGLATLGTGILTGVFPWFPHLTVMVIIRVAKGICFGLQDTGFHAMLFEIWGKKGGPFLQVTHILWAVGGILSPYITQFFLSDTAGASTIYRTDASTTLNKTNATSSAITLLSSSAGPPYVNTTSAPKSEDTNVQYAFIITSVLVCSSAIPFLVTYALKRKMKTILRQHSTDSTGRQKMPKKVKMLVLGIMCITSFFATANIDLFPNLLATFCVEQLHWNLESAALITSLSSGAYALGSITGIVVLVYVSSTKYVTVSYIATIAAIVGLLLSVIYEHIIMIWVTTGVCAFTMAALLPTIFTWIQENVSPITTRIASAMLVSGSVGVMINPIMLGYLMDNQSPMWFLYMLLGGMGLCSLFFFTAFTISRIYTVPGKAVVAEFSIEPSSVESITTNTRHTVDTSTMETITRL